MENLKTDIEKIKKKIENVRGYLWKKWGQRQNKKFWNKNSKRKFLER